jgi:hypothetical protein
LSTIKIPVNALEKIASFMERVPEMVSTISAPAPTSSPAPAPNRKEAEARVADLVKHAGLDPARQSEFANYILTNDGALKTIASLTSKVAALQSELGQARNLAVGVPSSVSAKSAAVPGNHASSAWCEALLS